MNSKNIIEILGGIFLVLEDTEQLKFCQVKLMSPDHLWFEKINAATAIRWFGFKKFKKNYQKDNEENYRNLMIFDYYFSN